MPYPRGSIPGGREWKELMTDDTDLLVAWRAGDRVAGERLLERYRSSLGRFFGHRAGWYADDLVQETLLACVRCRDRFAGQSSFRTYLFAIARKILHRSKDRWRPIPESDRNAVWSWSDRAEDDEEPELEAIQPMAPWERWDVHQIVRRLDLDDQRMIWLYYWNDLSGSELARTFGIRESTARSRLRRSLARMRQDLR